MLWRQVVVKLAPRKQPSASKIIETELSQTVLHRVAFTGWQVKRQTRTVGKLEQSRGPLGAVP